MKAKDKPILKTEKEINKIASAGQIHAAAMSLIDKLITQRVSTLEIDYLVGKLISESGGVPSFINHYGYRHSICASVNNVIVHGIPTDKVILPGDVVSIDIGVTFAGFIFDGAATWIVPEDGTDIRNNSKDLREESLLLSETARLALLAGIEAARAGNYVGDISQAIASVIDPSPFSACKSFVGHGLGCSLWEEPDVPNFFREKGALLSEGLVIAIEPIITMGNPVATKSDDGWSELTIDGSLAAHWETTIAIVNGAPLVLSPGPLIKPSNLFIT